ncbi:MAG TPA: hypothetical protein VM694_15375, partial [Polyangium sp.]|nr:hypothetical protein [Polyangium sp.]
AARAYAAAANMGRSDPEVHRAECELWEKMGWAALNSNADRQVPFEAGVEACNRAVQASSRDGRSLVQRALFLVARANAVSNSNAKDSAQSAAQAAVDAAEEALRARPQDVMARYAVATALHERAKMRFGRGEEVTVEEVIAAYERTQELDPLFTWTYNELGQVYMLASDVARLRGQDGRGALENARRQFERALSLDPAFSLPAFMTVEVLVTLLEQDIDQGKNADATVAALLGAISRLEGRKDHPWRTAFWRARANRMIATHEAALGRDPGGYTSAALAEVHAFAGASPRDAFFLGEIARCRLLEARHALRRGIDPEALIDAARQAVRDADSVRGTTILSNRILAARIELERVRAVTQLGRARASSFEPVFELVEPALQKQKDQPQLHRILAEVHALRAAFTWKSGTNPRSDIDAGLQRVEKVLVKNPHMASAFAVRGQLYLVEARSARSKAARVEAASHARSAFDTAFQENELLRKDHEDDTREIEALLR